jgi:hypothetical protein
MDDCKYFDHLFNYFMDSKPSDSLVSFFLEPLMIFQIDHPAELAAKQTEREGHPKIQQGLACLSNNEKAFQALLRDPDRTDVKIKTVNWSLLYSRRKQLLLLFSQREFFHFMRNINWNSLPKLSSEAFFVLFRCLSI